jgi:hypothetical protein
VQSERFAEPLRLRHAAAASDEVVNLLETDDVGLQSTEDRRRAVEIDDVVVPAAVFDVVADDAKRFGLRNTGGEDERCGYNERADHHDCRIICDEPHAGQGQSQDNEATRCHNPRMTRRVSRWLGALTLALTLPIAGSQAAQPPDPVTAEITRWLTAVEKNAGNGPLWDQVKPGAEAALRQALVAAQSGRPSFALERLSAARALLVAAIYVNERPANVRKDVTAFESEWRRLGAALGSALAPPPANAFSGVSSSATRALAEVAALQIKVNYDAGLEYGRATDADSGLFYLGAAQALQEFVAFAQKLPGRSQRAPALRSPAPDADALEQRLLSLYQPPASIDRHSEFISASAALKEARELQAAGLHYGAWFKLLQATHRTALLQASAVPTADVLRTRLAAVETELSEVTGDHTIARVFLDRAAIELEKATPDAAGLLAATVILDAVVPAYRASLAHAPATPAAVESKVTVRLVRWPFT